MGCCMFKCETKTSGADEARQKHAKEDAAQQVESKSPEVKEEFGQKTYTKEEVLKIWTKLNDENSNLKPHEKLKVYSKIGRYLLDNIDFNGRRVAEYDGFATAMLLFGVTSKKEFLDLIKRCYRILLVQKTDEDIAYFEKALNVLKAKTVVVLHDFGLDPKCDDQYSIVIFATLYVVLGIVPKFIAVGGDMETRLMRAQAVKHYMSTFGLDLHSSALTIDMEKHAWISGDALRMVKHTKVDADEFKESTGDMMIIGHLEDEDADVLKEQIPLLQGGCLVQGGTFNAKPHLVSILKAAFGKNFHMEGKPLTLTSEEWREIEQANPNNDWLQISYMIAVGAFTITEREDYLMEKNGQLSSALSRSQGMNERFDQLIRVQADIAKNFEKLKGG